MKTPSPLPPAAADIVSSYCPACDKCHPVRFMKGQWELKGRKCGATFNVAAGVLWWATHITADLQQTRKNVAHYTANLEKDLADLQRRVDEGKKSVAAYDAQIAAVPAVMALLTATSTPEKSE